MDEWVIVIPFLVVVLCSIAKAKNVNTSQGSHARGNRQLPGSDRTCAQRAILRAFGKVQRC